MQLNRNRQGGVVTQHRPACVSKCCRSTISAFFGPRDPRLNFVTVISWVVRWPLLAISYLLIGHLWCAICPMSALADILHHKIGLTLKALA